MAPEPVAPSPKFHAYVRVSPSESVADAVKLTVCEMSAAPRSALTDVMDGATFVGVGVGVIRRQAATAAMITINTITTAMILPHGVFFSGAGISGPASVSIPEVAIFLVLLNPQEQDLD